MKSTFCQKVENAANLCTCSEMSSVVFVCRLKRRIPENRNDLDQVAVENDSLGDSFSWCTSWNEDSSVFPEGEIYDSIPDDLTSQTEVKKLISVTSADSQETELKRLVSAAKVNKPRRYGRMKVHRHEGYRYPTTEQEQETAFKPKTISFSQTERERSVSETKLRPAASHAVEDSEDWNQNNLDFDSSFYNETELKGDYEVLGFTKLKDYETVYGDFTDVGGTDIYQSETIAGAYRKLGLIHMITYNENNHVFTALRSESDNEDSETN